MKAIVLSSGGVDSTTCVAIAIEKHGAENVSTVSVYYGQKHKKELECADKVAKHYGVNHYVLNLADVLKYSNCPLLERSSEEIQHLSYADQMRKDNGMVTTYVPFRNGLMLSAVSSLAVSIYPDEDIEVYLGNHADDSSGCAYADCSQEFVDAMTEAIRIGTYGKVHFQSPLCNLTKREVVKWGISLDVPYELTWSCYEGGEKACGSCGTCRDRLDAFRLNGIKDPIKYEE